MCSFIEQIWAEYPVPKDISIWEPTEDSEPVADLNVLLNSCLKELSSDLFRTEHIPSTGMTTNLPDDLVSIICVKLMQPFQGNRQVKYTLDRSTNQIHLRYYPSIISYKRKLRFQDLNEMVGDELRYAKSYVLWKMANKELQVLKSVKLDADNGEFDLSELKEFANSCKEEYTELKKEILIYGGNN